MPDRPSLLDNLIREANRTAARKPNSLDLLAQMIQLALKDGADPYLVAGLLMEGALSALVGYIPPGTATGSRCELVGAVFGEIESQRTMTAQLRSRPGTVVPSVRHSNAERSHLTRHHHVRPDRRFPRNR